MRVKVECNVEFESVSLYKEDDPRYVDAVDIARDVFGDFVEINREYSNLEYDGHRSDCIDVRWNEVNEYWFDKETGIEEVDGASIDSLKYSVSELKYRFRSFFEDNCSVEIVGEVK